MRHMKRNVPRWIAGLVAVAALGVVAFLAEPLWLRISTRFESSVVSSDRPGYQWREVLPFRRWDANTPHGDSVVYWVPGDGGAEMKAMEGRYEEGLSDGVWTHWRPDGSVLRQERHRAGAVIELRAEPPWWEGVVDQEWWPGSGAEWPEHRDQ